MRGKAMNFFLLLFSTVFNLKAGLVEELMDLRNWDQVQTVESKRIDVVDPVSKEKVFGFSYGETLKAGLRKLSDQDRELLGEKFRKDDGFSGVQVHPWLGVHREIVVLNFHGKAKFQIQLSKKDQGVVTIRQVFHVNEKLARFNLRAENQFYLEVKNKELWEVLNRLSEDDGE